MTCRDAERSWNELIDARDDPRPGLEAALEAHASGCPACAEVADRYRRLRGALARLAPPTAPAGFVDRLVAASGDRPRLDLASRRRQVFLLMGTGLGSAAAAAIVVALAIGRGPGKPVESRPAANGVAAVPGASGLREALVDATSATIELAREASAPAGRVGRVVFTSAARPLDGVAGEGREPRSPIPAGAGPAERSAPIGGSARRAFGFLVPSVAGPSLEAVPAGRPKPRGL